MLVFVLFLGVSWQFYGPAYLSDEIGYLDKAATVAGLIVHAPSSWFGGYPILISPAFFISSDPFIEWRIVLIINALLWAGVAALVRIFIGYIAPKTSLKARLGITALSLSYPSWLTMSGYAFSTTAFVATLMASLVLLAHGVTTKQSKWFILSALAAGFLLWIHPLGVIYIIGFSGYCALYAWARRSVRPLIAVATVGLSAFCYLGIIHPWFARQMSAIASDSRYSDTINALVASLTSREFWLRFSVLLLSLLMSSLISSYGLVAIAARHALDGFHTIRRQWRSKITEPAVMLPILTVTLFMGALIFNALSTASQATLRTDEWIYGRYTDLYVLPLLVIGIATITRAKKTLLAASSFVLVAGGILQLVATKHNTAFDLLNKVNIASFWPMWAFVRFDIISFWIWALAGGCAIVLVWFSIHHRHYWLLGLLMLPILLCDVAGLRYHRNILHDHSTVTSLYSYLKTSTTDTSCLGFSDIVDNQERFSLYSYYLHGRNIQRLTVDQWQAQKCQGPYFTYDRTTATNNALYVSGEEKKTGLLMLTRQPQAFVVFQ